MKTALFLCANFLALLLPWGFVGAEQTQGIRRRMTTEEDSEGILSKMWKSGANTWFGQIIGRSDCDPTPAPVPTTEAPTTHAPTPVPTTASPTTASPTTASPTTASPTTASPTTPSPTTARPTTSAPTTRSPTTPSPTTPSPTTARPTTATPTRRPTHLNPATCEYTGPPRKSFTFRNELRAALEQAYAAINNPTAQVFQDYGYPVGAWDVSKVVTFDSLFQHLHGNIGDLNCWDTSQVTNMDKTFYATGFNGDVSAWDTSNVRSMKSIFGFTTSTWNAFKGEALKTWNTGSVQDMSNAFESSYIRGVDIEDWDVSSVTNFQYMFHYSEVAPDLGRWNTGSATSMSSMFHGNRNFKGDIAGWDVSSVANFDNMFYRSGSVSGIAPDLSRWNTGSATSMSQMFRENHNFNSNIGGWDMSHVVVGNYMFGDAKSFNQVGQAKSFSVWLLRHDVVFGLALNPRWFVRRPFAFLTLCITSVNVHDISPWDMSNFENAYGMFYNAAAFDQDISGWDVSKLQYATNMFNGANAFNQDLCEWRAHLPTSQNILSWSGSFAETSCPNTADPVSLNGGPFCHPCTT